MNNTTYTDAETKQMMYDYISTHNVDLTKMAKSIARNNTWEDLLQEVTFSILKSKRFPEDIFIRGKEFLYIFSIMKRQYYWDNGAFRKKFAVQAYEFKYDKFGNLDDSQFDNDGIEEQYDLSMENDYNNILQFVDEAVANDTIDKYAANCFRLVYVAHDIDKYLLITDLQKKILTKRNGSYRSAENVTGINFQSIRYSALEVINYIKENYKTTKEIL